MSEWNFAVPDWEDRIRRGRSLIPDLPLFMDEAENGLAFFDALHLSDVPGTPALEEACGAWFREIAGTIAGSRDPLTNRRHIPEILLMAPKGSSKTSYAAGVALMLLFLNERPRAEIFLVAPSQSTAEVAYDQITGMIDLDPELKRRFRAVPGDSEIIDLTNRAKIAVKTFGMNIMTGGKPMVVILDEIHLMGKDKHAEKIMTQIRGGLRKNTESLLFMLTTQSDEKPAGLWKAELATARLIRDGKITGIAARMLPILYEFPDDIATDEKKFENPKNWHMVMPNLGLSIHLDDLVAHYELEKTKGEKQKTLWLSQHLNIEVGRGIRPEGWIGAELWPARARRVISLETILWRCDVVTVGIDGGGRDDLLGMCVIGRDRVSRKWLVWCRAWAFEIMLKRRSQIETILRDFEKEGSLKVLADDSGDDVKEVVDLLEQFRDAGLLPETQAIGVDKIGMVDIVDEMERRKFSMTTDEVMGQVVGVKQGTALETPIHVVERRLAMGTMEHDGSDLMEWCVTNAKVSYRGAAMMIEQQDPGVSKIDPLMALFNAAQLMSLNPEPMGISVFEQGVPREERDDGRVDMEILGNPLHPRFHEMLDRWNALLPPDDD